MDHGSVWSWAAAFVLWDHTAGKLGQQTGSSSILVLSIMMPDHQAVVWQHLHQHGAWQWVQMGCTLSCSEFLLQACSRLVASW